MAPSIPGAVDRNDWNSYYEYGIERIGRDRKGAEEAFLWASQLDPSRAEPLYAAWITFWARDPRRFAKYVAGDESVRREPDVLRSDTLRMMALRRNPFVHQGFIMFLFEMLPGNWQDDLVTRAWISYANAELPAAVEQFGRAVRRDPKKFGYLRFNRASAFVNLGNNDSALVDIAALLAQLRADDNEKVGEVYQSKELLEYAQGLLHRQGRRTRAAREAFGRAVVENPGFTPARAMLGDLAIAAHDTAAALLEYSTAVEIDPKDVMMRLGYGKALLAAFRPADAASQLKTAVSLAPAYAALYYWLGMAFEGVSDRENSHLAYVQFLSRSSRDDVLRPEVEERLRVLAATRGR